MFQRLWEVGPSFFSTIDTDSTRVYRSVSIDQGIEESKKDDEDMDIDLAVRQFLERTRIDLARSN